MHSPLRPLYTLVKEHVTKRHLLAKTLSATSEQGESYQNVEKAEVMRMTLAKWNTHAQTV